jgi:nucleotide-binding universal stress UspA family protein
MISGMDVISRLLVAVDGSVPSDAAVGVALRLGGLTPRPTIRFLSVFDRTILDDDVCRRALDGALARARDAGIEATAVLRTGTPAVEIATEADAWNATCIVTGTHGRTGLSRMTFGSISEGVLERSVRPLLVVHAGPQPAALLGRLMCAFDGSDAARRAFEAAARLAAYRGAELHLLSVVQLDDLYASGYERDGFDPDGSIGLLYDDAKRELKALVAVKAASGLRVALHVAGGADVAGVIAACATRFGCDLIVMGTHGRRGLSRALLGSTADGVIHDAGVPVLVTRRRAPVAARPVPLRASSVAC